MPERDLVHLPGSSVRRKDLPSALRDLDLTVSQFEELGITARKVMLHDAAQCLSDADALREYGRGLLEAAREIPPTSKQRFTASRYIRQVLTDARAARYQAAEQIQKAEELRAEQAALGVGEVKISDAARLIRSQAETA